jgi:4'-phosphopantetheinyl transferase
MQHGTVDVWCADLDGSSHAFSEFWCVLSHEERAKAFRIRSQENHKRFVIQHGLLRFLLSHYVPVAPAQHKFTHGRRGKPELERARGLSRLYFNMSHSSDKALYAMTGVTEVGVDIERIRPLDDLDSLARGFFTPHEAATLNAQTPKKKLEAFFNCWTRKEAILKATGQGITGGLDGVEVTVTPDEPAHVLNTKDKGDNTLPWSLHAWLPARGYVAALAYRGPRLELKFREALLPGEGTEAHSQDGFRAWSPETAGHLHAEGRRTSNGGSHLPT